MTFDADLVAREHGEDPPPDAPILSAALRKVVPAERNGLAFVTARDLATRVPATPDFRVEGYWADGSITELVGKIKAAGKTTLALGMCSAVIRGADFAGMLTVKTPIVYLTEQPDPSFRQALTRAGLVDSEDLIVLSWHQTIGVTWPKVAAAAVQECLRRGARALVVDTLGHWAGIRGEGENSAGDALEAVRPLQVAASVHGIAVLVIRHARKGGGEVGDDGRGSSAFAGAVDIVVSVRRPEGGGDPSVRVLHALSRFAETPESLALQFTANGYVSLGSEAAMAVEVAKRQILDACPTSAASAKTMDELIESAGVRRTSGQEAIAALLELERLSRVGAGRRGDPFRYFAFLSAATTSLGAAETNGHS